MSYNSKYKGSEVEEKLDKIDQLNAGMVDADEELEEVNTLPCVKYVQQTLTDEQKAIARENIGVGEGSEDLTEIKASIETINTEIESINTALGNISTSTPEIDHGTADTTLEIEPNVFHKWGEVASLSLSLGAEKEGVVNEFLFQFASGADATTLSLPEGIEWENGAYPDILANATYQVSIVNSLASIVSYYTRRYLTIEALEDLTVSFSSAVEYRINNLIWKSAGAGEEISLAGGSIIQYRANLTPNSSSGIGKFTVSGMCNLSGNCMSLLFGDNANGVTDLSDYPYAFYKLFEDCAGIINVSKDFLPATILSNYCYNFMFHNCSSLVVGPDIRPTAVGDGSCYVMFWNCTSMIKGPSVLPATTLATKCYYSMFYDCASLEVAPELPATTLVSECYSHTFYGCSKLNYIKASFTTTPSKSYTLNWVSGVASSGTFVKNKNATWSVTGVNGIPSGWTVKTE